MKIKINHLPEHSDKEELALFEVYQVTPTIEQAIELLEGSQVIVAKSLGKEKVEKLSFSDVRYIEYLERQIFLYTEKHEYFVRHSFVSFLEKLPPYFIQISQNTAVNLYFVTAFSPQLNGNLWLKLTSEEQLQVSRRYVKKIKAAFKQLSF